MRVLCCLIMAAVMLNVSAFAGEVWVLDLDAGPVVINEDGLTEPWEPDSALLAEEPDSDLVEDLVEDFGTEEVVSDPVEDFNTDEPVIDSVEDTSADAIEEPFFEVVEDPVYDEIPDTIVSSEDDLIPESEPTVMLFSLNEVDAPLTYSEGDSESMTMKDVIVQVFGEYSPRTQTVTQYLSDGTVLDSATEIVPGVAGMDWQWLSGVFLFSVVLISFMKMVGVLLKNG